MEQQYQYTIDKESITANRLNEDVIVIWGCTFKEIVRLLMASYALALIVVLPLSILMGKGFLGMIVVLILGGIFLMISANWIAKKKEGKPRRYYQHLIKIKLEKAGLGFSKEKFVFRSGKWTVRRLIKDEQNG